MRLRCNHEISISDSGEALKHAVVYASTANRRTSSIFTTYENNFVDQDETEFQFVPTIKTNLVSNWWKQESTYK